LIDPILTALWFPYRARLANNSLQFNRTPSLLNLNTLILEPLHIIMDHYKFKALDKSIVQIQQSKGYSRRGTHFYKRWNFEKGYALKSTLAKVIFVFWGGNRILRYYSVLKKNNNKLLNAIPPNLILLIQFTKKQEYWLK
jgi:hypothetical protein